MALCFSCGNVKFGALCPCDACESGPTGNIELDIHFSDHLYAVETLEAFGEVIRSIRRVCDDDRLCFHAFLLYISENHGEILKVQFEPRATALCASVLKKARPPKVEVRESSNAFLRRNRPSLS